MSFELFNSKELGTGPTFNLIDPTDRLKYFHFKLGTKITDLKTYLANDTFVAYLLAKKQAGKGTYAKMIIELLGVDRVLHISVGDLVRDFHQLLQDSGSDPYIAGVRKHYRGFISFEDAVEKLKTRSQETVSVPDELILALLKQTADNNRGRALLIDGVPRTVDQISYSLFIRDMINYRSDRDLYIAIDVSDSIIDMRMRNRLVCPICHTSKHGLLNPTKFVKFDKALNEFYFLCDNSNCAGYEKSRLVAKEGDEHGIESIRDRLDMDQKLIDTALSLHGIPKISVSSSYLAASVATYLEPYEVQKGYVYNVSPDGTVVSTEQSLVSKDAQGEASVMPYAAVFVVNILNQLHGILCGSADL